MSAKERKIPSTGTRTDGDGDDIELGDNVSGIPESVTICGPLQTSSWQRPYLGWLAQRARSPLSVDQNRTGKEVAEPHMDGAYSDMSIFGLLDLSGCDMHHVPPRHLLFGASCRFSSVVDPRLTPPFQPNGATEPIPTARLDAGWSHRHSLASGGTPAVRDA
ncbi:hypothetical protein IMZ48_27880 [Candidatus Bathyarchaeota archaeon]|nr:hypothetical protein [Candidatus Bathyarchaeota archaeon]